jgi:predicted secreted protein
VVAPRILTEADDGAHITVRAGDSFAVRLHENATTGYRWVLDPALASFLVEQSEEHLPASSEESGIGAGGSAVFAFVVVAGARGDGIVRLRHGRSWEARPLETCTFYVTASP